MSMYILLWGMPIFLVLAKGEMQINCWIFLKGWTVDVEYWIVEFERIFGTLGACLN